MILPWHVKDWPEDAREAYEERSGILQFDARMPKARAEALAEEMVRREWRERRASHPPRPARRSSG